MKPLLSICIPTYNRLRYLRKLINEIIRQHNNLTNKDFVEVLVSDNASTDGTKKYFYDISKQAIHYYRNRKNIGADSNYIECIKKAHGKYIWLFGDDEIIYPNAIENILCAIKKNHYSLIIMLNLKTRRKIKIKIFNSYLLYLKHIIKKHSSCLMSNTIITSQVFLKSAFNVNFAKNMLWTCYGHMYTITPAILLKGKVFLLPHTTYKIRSVRAKVNINIIILVINLWLYVVYIAIICRSIRLLIISFTSIFERIVYESKKYLIKLP